MSASPAPASVSTAKASPGASDKAPESTGKPTAALEEDDEFEDFPVEGKLLTLPGFPSSPLSCSCLSHPITFSIVLARLRSM